MNNFNPDFEIVDKLEIIKNLLMGILDLIFVTIII